MRGYVSRTLRDTTFQRKAQRQELTTRTEKAQLQKQEGNQETSVLEGQSERDAEKCNQRSEFSPEAWLEGKDLAL